MPVITRSAQVYADDCYFEDPNNKFDGLGTVNWSKGVKFLFIGERCKLALTGPVTLDEQARTITFEGWRQVCGGRRQGAGAGGRRVSRERAGAHYV